MTIRGKGRRYTGTYEFKLVNTTPPTYRGEYTPAGKKKSIRVIVRLLKD